MKGNKGLKTKKIPVNWEAMHILMLYTLEQPEVTTKKSFRERHTQKHYKQVKTEF